MSSTLEMVLMAGMGSGPEKVGERKRFWLVVLCCLFCLLSPPIIATLGMVYGPESDPGMDAPWSLYAIDALCFADFCFTALLIWAAHERRWITAMAAIPLLIFTAVMAFFGGLWVSGNYF